MVLVRLFLVCLAIPAICGASSWQGSAKQAYPAVIKDSPERRERAERIWRRMLAVYGAPQTPPDLYPITCTPRSLLGITGGIKLTSEPLPADSDPLALRELIRGFIGRWRDLIGAEPGALSLVSADQSGAVQRLTYKQANYAFPLAPPSGELVVMLGNDGKLMQLDDRLVPVVELPSRPALEKEAAAKRLVGRVFTYTDFAGHEQRAVIGSEADITVKQLVVLVTEKADAVEVRLAWEVAAGTSLSWTVYLDAINGEELRVVQNFQT